MNTPCIYLLLTTDGTLASQYAYGSREAAERDKQTIKDEFGEVPFGMQELHVRALPILEDRKRGYES